MRTSFVYLSKKLLLAHKISTSGIVIANEGWFLCSHSSLPVAEKPILKVWMDWTKSRMSPPAHSTAEEETPTNLWLLFSWTFQRGGKASQKDHWVEKISKRGLTTQWEPGAVWRDGGKIMTDMVLREIQGTKYGNGGGFPDCPRCDVTKVTLSRAEISP